ncbi:hypothetical protein TNIN_241991 [Trichonephila inaurata madagascariensis]|uniref:Uncharacterized protein n=1 Tax=Trichonephila inaurata madagascariensis TaxID=2747483 RepID=A0A8X6IQM2_9ARAC|nr:hypothetical protein TNIN_241991 [Trichonephila inaurata madagascariensis]
MSLFGEEGNAWILEENIVPHSGKKCFYVNPSQKCGSKITKTSEDLLGMSDEDSTEPCEDSLVPSHDDDREDPIEPTSKKEIGFMGLGQ